MSITRSYNKYTDTYYAYDTTYEWDEKQQKKVQRKKCIGKFDPTTGEIIPNGRRGRPLKQKSLQESITTIADEPKSRVQIPEEVISKAKALLSKIESIETTISKATVELTELRNSLKALISQMLSED